MTEQAVFFTDKYASYAHLGQPVGIDGSNVLLLGRKQSGQTGEWITTPLDGSQVLGIRVTKYRAWSSIAAGLITAGVAAAIAYFGIEGDLWGPGVLTIPLFLAPISFCCIKYSMSISFDFETDKQHYTYTNSVSDTLPAIPVLLDWAKSNRIHVVIDYQLKEEATTVAPFERKVA